MRTLRYVTVALALAMAISADAGARKRYSATKTATTTSTEHGFGFPASKFTLVNDGSVTVYVDDECGTATSADSEVRAGETYSPPEIKRHDFITCISILSASATASVRIYAYE